MRPLNAAAYGEALSVSCSVGYLTATTVGSASAADGSAISHALPSAVRPRSCVMLSSEMTRTLS